MLPPSTDFHSPPAGEPIQIILASIGSKAIQFTLPFPLFLLLDKMIGVFIGPFDTQLLADVVFALEYFSCSFFHSINNEFGLNVELVVTLSLTKSISRAYGLYPFPLV